MSRLLVEYLTENQDKFYSQARQITKNKELAWDIIQMSYEFLLKRNQEDNYVEHPDSYLHLLILGRYMNYKRLASNKLFDTMKTLDDEKTEIQDEISFCQQFEEVMSDIQDNCYPAEIKAVEYMLDQNRPSIKKIGARYQSLKTSRRLAIQRMKKFYGIKTT